MPENGKIFSVPNRKREVLKRRNLFLCFLFFAVIPRFVIIVRKSEIFNSAVAITVLA